MWVRRLPLDKFLSLHIIEDGSHNKSIFGVPVEPAEIGILSLTREPDTASTVGGKDAHMRYHCVSHCTWTGLQCGIFVQEVEFS